MTNSSNRLKEEGRLFKASFSLKTITFEEDMFSLKASLNEGQVFIDS